MIHRELYIKKLVELNNSLREVYYEPHYPFALWEVFMADKYL